MLRTRTKNEYYDARHNKMAPVRQARRIALVGASGNIGSSTLRALLSHGIHNITVISRPESQSTFPSNVAVMKGSYDDEDFLVSALKDIDFLVLQLPIAAVDLQQGFIHAAAKAGVPWILPTEFGSDPDATQLHPRFPFLVRKKQRRELITQLGVSSWVAVVTNPWYDFCFSHGEWGIDIPGRKATLWDGGNYPMNTTTLARAGEATAELLAFPDAELARYRNGVFRITSFHVTQREILDSVLRATGTSEKDWQVTTPAADEVNKDFERRLADKPDGDTHVDYDAFAKRFMLTHFLPGLGGDFNDKVEDLSKLGLEKEDFDEATRGVVASLEKRS